MPTIPLGGHFYRAPATNIAALECVNLYPFYPQTQTTSEKTLLAPTGIELNRTFGVGGNRGGILFQGFPYFVNGTEMWRFRERQDALARPFYGAQRQNRDVPITGNSRVKLAVNPTQICIVTTNPQSLPNVWIFNQPDNTFEILEGEIFDELAPEGVQDVMFIDGYFMFIARNTQRYFISELNDGRRFRATDFATAESSNDLLIGMGKVNNEPLLFSEGTTQLLQNVGGEGFPFVVVQGAIYEVGAITPNAIVEVNDTIIFLGRERKSAPAFWITRGDRPQRLSTVPIDAELSRYSEGELKQCFSFTYSEKGAQFVGFTFLNGRTFVYETISQEWHTRVSLTPNLENTEPSAISVVVAALGKLFVGNRFTNQLGILNSDVFDEFNQGYLPRYFVTPPIDNEGKPFFLNSVELVCQVGFGNKEGPFVDPRVSMSFSVDGGRTFNRKIERSLGKRGDFTQRVIWNAQGRIPRQVCFRFDFSDPVDFSVEKVEVNFG